MKILITRSSSLLAGASLLRALEAQKQYPIAPHIEQVVISDREIPGVNLKIITEPALTGPGGYWHSKVRNIAFSAALESGADYLITLDSDAVFLGFGESGPSFDFERLNGFYSRRDEIITKEALADPSRWIFNSWWVMSRKMLMNHWCRSYEGFIGYGWEDFDFLHNIAMPNGFHQANSNGTAIHLWHDPKRNAPDPEFDLEFLRNRRLYSDRYQSIHGMPAP